jgi:hypothetical protein
VFVYYPNFNISEREYSSANTPASTKASKMQQNIDTTRKSSDSDIALPQYESFPPPAITSAQEKLLRNDSSHSVMSNESAKSQHIDAEYAQYTNAPPPFAESQYEGKSEEQQTEMRKADYAKELKRMMGRQLVRGLKNGETKIEES